MNKKFMFCYIDICYTHDLLFMTFTIKF